MLAYVDNYYNNLEDDPICDTDLISHLQSNDLPRRDLNHLRDILWKRYCRQAGQAWNVLSRQLNFTSSLLSQRDDFLCDCMEEMFKAVDKIDIDKIYDKKWKFYHYYAWVLKNLRATWIKKILKDSKVLSFNESPLTDPEDNTDNSYLENLAVENNPEYDSRNDFERAEAVATLHIAYKECSKNWSDKKILVYTETLNGKSKKEIARELGMTYQGTKNILDKIIVDLRKELVKERI